MKYSRPKVALFLPSFYCSKHRIVMFLCAIYPRICSKVKKFNKCLLRYLDGFRHNYRFPIIISIRLTSSIRRVFGFFSRYVAIYIISIEIFCRLVLTRFNKIIKVIIDNRIFQKLKCWHLCFVFEIRIVFYQ